MKYSIEREDDRLLVLGGEFGLMADYPASSDKEYAASLARAEALVARLEAEDRSEAMDAGIRRIGIALVIWSAMAKLWKARCQKCGAATAAGNKYSELCYGCDGFGWTL